jgi:hypothetical protein
MIKDNFYLITLTSLKPFPNIRNKFGGEYKIPATLIDSRLIALNNSLGMTVISATGIKFTKTL